MQLSRKQQRVRAKEDMILAAITIAELPIEEWARWVVHLLERLDIKAHARNFEYDVFHPPWLVAVGNAIATRLLDGSW